MVFFAALCAVPCGSGDRLMAPISRTSRHETESSASAGFPANQSQLLCVTYLWYLVYYTDGFTTDNRG